MAIANSIPMSQPALAKSSLGMRTGPSANEYVSFKIRSTLMFHTAHELTNARCGHFPNMTVGDEAAVDRHHVEFVRLIGLQGANNDMIAVQYFISLEPSGLSLDAILGKEMRTGITTHVRVPEHFNVGVPILRWQQLPLEVWWIGRSRAASECLPFDEIAKMQNDKSISKFR